MTILQKFINFNNDYNIFSYYTKNIIPFTIKAKESPFFFCVPIFESFLAPLIYDINRSYFWFLYKNTLMIASAKPKYNYK